MKKLLIVILGALLLHGCGTPAGTSTAAKEEKAKLSFVSDTKTPITVTVDKTETYKVYTLTEKSVRSTRDVQNTVRNTLLLPPGEHEIVVTADGREICRKKVVVSAREHQVIEL